MYFSFYFDLWVMALCICWNITKAVGLSVRHGYLFRNDSFLLSVFKLRPHPLTSYTTKEAKNFFIGCNEVSNLLSEDKLCIYIRANKDITKRWVFLLFVPYHSSELVNQHIHRSSLVYLTLNLIPIKHIKVFISTPGLVVQTPSESSCGTLLSVSQWSAWSALPSSSVKSLFA